MCVSLKMKSPTWSQKLLPLCLMLTPSVAFAQNLPALRVHSATLEGIRFSVPDRMVQPEHLQSFAAKTSGGCGNSKDLPSGTSDFSLPLVEPWLILPEKRAAGERQTYSCGTPSFQPVLTVAPRGLPLCRPNAVAGMSSGCILRPNLLFPLWNSESGSSFANPVLKVQNPREQFHWRPALWQSFEFLVFEHSVRLASDSYARYLVFHKPFWHDYLVSADHFNMNRWADGDSFLVNYIGHPLQGAVSGNVFIQNDPVGRSARFGKSSAYWQSRLKAMAWAGVYSAYFEIGPVLSETALGNEGGYTYIPGCGMEGKCVKEPGKTYKPPTNNTGWVDFVITPTIGMGWIVLEDAIEVKIVDKVASDHRSAKHNLLLAGLTPSRTMANFLAGKHPWYRPTETESTTAAFGAPLKSVAPRPEWKNDPRWSLGMQFTALNLPMDREGCPACRKYTPGAGFTFDYRVSRFVSFDSEYNLFPGTGKTGKSGGAQEVLAGLKVGRTFRSWGLFSQVRPGFIHFDKTLVPGSSTDYESTTRFALDLGGSVEYYASRRSTFRFNLGTTLVHYETGNPDPMQPPVTVLSSKYYATQGNFHIGSGYAFRF
jgi:hypothetical protein